MAALTRYADALDHAARTMKELLQSFGGEVEAQAVIEQSRQHYARVLDSLKKRLTKKSIKSVTELAVGHPAEQIILYAERHGIDHIVVGHRGHASFERWLLGSVARHVIDHAQRAVTVVRQRT
jgi:nucleotide-binding universal stress UspA family protein